MRSAALALIVRAPTVGACVLFASPALAAGGGEGGGDFVWQVVNFFILVGALVYFARKPVVDYLASRRTQITEDIETASQVLSASEQHFSEWQGKLVELEAEVEEIRREAQERAEHERQQILAEAQDAAERISRDAIAAVDQELRRAQLALRREASELAVDLAGKLLVDNVNDADRERLMDEFITRVEQSGATGR